MADLRIGQAVARFEDARLLSGQGRYTDDLKFPGEAHLVLVRSTYAHAVVTNIDASAARASPGVLAVLTRREADARGLGTFSNRIRRERRPGQPMFEPLRHVLAGERVRYVGDPLVAVVAETRDQARDAAELVAVDYDPLPALTSGRAALQPRAPVLWEEAPDNVAFVFAQGERVAARNALSGAAHIASFNFDVTRVTANPIEPRAAVGLFDSADQRYTLYVTTQTPHSLRQEIAANVFRMPANRLRVVARDVGGAFGMKGSDFHEYALVLWAAEIVKRPVRWLCDRSEAFLSDHQARDNSSKVRLGLAADGRFLGLEVETVANLGAYLAYAGTHQATNNIGGVAGVYTTPHIHVEVTGVLTNTLPVAPYRGAGRPEASYAIERVIDIAAVEMGIDRIALRRKNLIPREAMPFRTGLVFTYDSGDFAANMDMVLNMADWAGFPQRRGDAAKRGKLRGIGFANAIEIAAGPPDLPFEEAAEVRFDPSGAVTILVGTHSHGQGHETAFRQVASELLGLDGSLIRIAYGDTDALHHGKGTFGSRSLAAGGAAIVRSVEKVVEKGRAIAAHLLETAKADIEFNQGRFVVAGTDRTISISEVARAAYNPRRLPREIEPGLAEVSTVIAKGATFPNSAHVCEVEIDEDTGVVQLVGYWVADDVGRVVNPMLLKGQVHGGVAQGVGQVLAEAIRYDDSGQILTGSFLDYCMPRASDLPMIKVGSNEVPTTSNPLGVKGAGEAGTVGALPAVVNAVCDALRKYGIQHIDMPLSPERVWRAMQEAKRASPRRAEEAVA